MIPFLKVELEVFNQKRTVLEVTFAAPDDKKSTQAKSQTNRYK